VVLWFYGWLGSEGQRLQAYTPTTHRRPLMLFLLDGYFKLGRHRKTIP
jgi:hypothetical protein